MSLTYLTDFFILDIEEDREVPIIMGRPFLATGSTLIDMANGELTMSVQDQEVTFKVFKTMKFPKESYECFMLDILDKCVCFMLDILDECVDDKKSDGYFSDPLETTIVNSACGERWLLQLKEKDEFIL